MSLSPYPGYPPNFRIVDVLGGMHRTCLVIEVLSLGSIDDLQLSVMRDQLEGLLEKMKVSMPMIEKTKVALPTQFDKLLRDGLRIS